MDNTRKFQRTTEDFTCEHCGFFVRGSGYTNHCPQCLWSTHVDVNPGDRSALCGGMMEPVGVEVKHGSSIILHRCVRCGFEKRNKSAKDDNFETIAELSSRRALARMKESWQ